MENICRLCLNEVCDINCFIFDQKHVPLVIVEKLRTCIPEINMNLVEESALCNSCLDDLTKAFDFKRCCLQSEKRIRDYIKSISPNETNGRLNKLTLNVVKGELDDTVENITVKTEICNTFSLSEDTKRSDLSDMVKKDFEDSKYKITENSTPMPTINVVKSDEIQYPSFSEVYLVENVTIPKNNNFTEDTNSTKLATTNHSNRVSMMNTNSGVHVVKQCVDVPITSPLTKNQINLSTKEKPEPICATLPLLQGILNGNSNAYSFYNNNLLMLNNFQNPITSPTEGKHYKCETCGYETFGSTNLQEHVCSHAREKPFKCKVCDRVFSRKQNLLRHNRIHTGEKPFTCEICNKPFTQKAHVQIHMKIHTGEKPFECKICDYKCSWKMSLKAHIRTHTKEKPFKCDICDYKCSQKSGLNLHLRTHTGEKPFLCDVCGYSCTEKGSLSKHVLIHTGEKPFKCKICDKKFRTKSILRIHLRSHTGVKPYKCDTCGYKFATKEVLRRHIRIHTGEKPFKCHICDYKSSQRQHLRYHIQTHTAEKTFACESCDFSCSKKLLLQNHVKSHKT